MGDVLLIVENCGTEFYEIPYQVAYHPDAVELIKEYNEKSFAYHNSFGSKEVETEHNSCLEKVERLLEAWKELGYMKDSYGAYGKYHSGDMIFISIE